MSPELLPGQLAPTVDEAGPGPPPRPKLRRPERRPDPSRWRDVIPPALAEEVADGEALERHRELVERVDAAAVKLRELEAARGRAVEQDRQAGADFAAGNSRKLPPAAAPDAEAAVEQARRELELLERELPTAEPSCSSVSCTSLAPVIDSTTAQTGSRCTPSMRLASVLNESTSGGTASWSRCSPSPESRQTSSLFRLRSSPACNM
jgi:hypothetical protein